MESISKVKRKNKLGFPFSRQDEIDIRKACEEAGRYMLTYGRGATPRPIDLRFYQTGIAGVKPEKVKNKRKKNISNT